MDSYDKFLKSKKQESVPVVQIYSARDEELKKSMKELMDWEAKKAAAPIIAAENSIKQVSLLEAQLQVANDRNDILQKNYSELEKINTQLKEESKANKLAARKAKKLNIAAFILSIVLPLISIGASVLIAIFL